MKKVLLFAAILSVGVVTASELSKEDLSDIQRTQKILTTLKKAKAQCNCADYDAYIKEGVSRVDEVLNK